MLISPAALSGRGFAPSGRRCQDASRPARGLRTAVRPLHRTGARQLGTGAGLC